MFVKSAREALNAEEVPSELIRVLVEYIQYIEVNTVRHNFESENKTLILIFYQLIKNFLTG